MVRNVLAILIASTLLASCATKYQSSGLLGGYQEKQLGSNMMLVTFQGNGYSSPDKTYQFAMKRAAEVTMQHGYQYFEVLSQRSFMDNKTSYTTAGQFSSDFPRSELKIKFLSSKTPKAYDAKNVFTSVLAD